MKDFEATQAIALSSASCSLRLTPSGGEIDLGDTATVRRQAGKTTADMIDLLYGRDEKLYDFYVGLEAKADAEVIAATGLRYDYIIVYPGKIAGEYKKTSGHEHIGPYPEVYEIVSGTAMFLLQRGEGADLDYFAAIKAEAGQKILVPPGYGHATVNIGAEPLVFADLVFDACQNQYGVIKDNHGMGYYLLERDGERVFAKNPSYASHPEIVSLDPYEQPELGLVFTRPIYDVLVKEPETFRYLSDPEAFMASINRLADLIQRSDRQ